jgi:hypothetical protein
MFIAALFTIAKLQKKKVIHIVIYICSGGRKRKSSGSGYTDLGTIYLQVNTKAKPNEHQIDT